MSKHLGGKGRGTLQNLPPRWTSASPTKSAWAVIDGLEAIKWSYSWACYGTDVVADALVSPFIRLVRQRPQELHAVKSLYEASAWELCMLMRSGMGFEAAVTDVTGRTNSMREYLEDFKFQAHRPGSRLDRRSFTGGDAGGRRQRSPARRRFYSPHPARRSAPCRSRSPPSRRSPYNRFARTNNDSRQDHRRLDDKRSQGDRQDKRPTIGVCVDFQAVKCSTQGPCPRGYITSVPRAAKPIMVLTVAGLRPRAEDSTGAGACVDPVPDTSITTPWARYGTRSSITSGLWWWGSSRLEQLHRILKTKTR